MSPSAEPENIFPDVVRVRHASRSSSRDPTRKTFRPPSECLPNATPVPSAPAVKTLRKPPELTTRSECLNSKLPPGALRVATCPETHPGRIPNASRKPRLHHVYRAADLPDAAGQPANHPGRPSRTLGECAACRPSRERNSRK